MDRKHLNIGTYFLDTYAHTEQHVKDMHECGIDFVICVDNDKTLLDWFEKYNVATIVEDIFPTWWGSNGGTGGTMKEHCPLNAYMKAAMTFKDHPAAWGINIGDEPSALDMPHYGDAIRTIRNAMPDKHLYLNLYPNYASVAQTTDEQAVSQLGTASYKEHIEAYCKYVPLDYISYDYYVYSLQPREGRPYARVFENLRDVADACRNTGRDAWIVLQVNSSNPDVWLSENMLRYQAFTAMCYGYRAITWACWTAGWWYNQVLDDKGNKTEQYEKLKKVNAEIHRLAEEYDKYHRVETYFVGFDGTPWLNESDIKSVSKLNTAFFNNISSEKPIVVGDMLENNGSGRALFICAADDPYDVNPSEFTITLNCGKKIEVFGQNGKKDFSFMDGKYQIKIKSNEAVLVKEI